MLRLQEALSALAVLTVVSDGDSHDVIENLVPDTRPPPPEAEKLLPVVHTTWGFLLSGLTLPAPAALTEEAARLLAHVAAVAGGFIARRFERDALPLLLRLLGGGDKLSRFGGADRIGYRWLEDGPACGSRHRCQLAMLDCLSACCVMGEGRRVISGVVGRIATAVLSCFAAAGSAEVAEAALRCLRRLAAIDTDEVWLLVLRVLHGQQAEALRELTKGCPLVGLEGLDVCKGQEGGVWRGNPGAWVAQCAQLLREIDGMHVVWHDEVLSARAIADEAAGVTLA
jgi:hypothetical protein